MGAISFPELLRGSQLTCQALCKLEVGGRGGSLWDKATCQDWRVEASS